MMKKNNLSNRLFLFILLGALISFVPFDVMAAQECSPLGVLIDQGVKTFILEGAFNTIRDVCCKVAAASWDLFATALKDIVGIGIAIYIASHTLKNLGAFSNQDVSAYLGKILPVVIKGTIIICLLNNNTIVYKWLVAPILEVGLEVGRFGDNDIDVKFNSSEDLSSLFGAIVETAKLFNNEAYKLVALGRLLLCATFLPDGIFDWFWSLVPFGMTLFVFGWLIIVGMSFYLLDMTIRLGVACTMLPIALACGISKLTSNYTKQTWNLFINVAFNFIMLNVIIKFTKDMVKASLEKISGDAIITAAGTGVFAILEKVPVTEVLAKQITDSLSVKSFAMMTLCCIIAFKLCMEIETITDKLSSTKGVGSLNQKVAADGATVGINKIGSTLSSIKETADAAVGNVVKGIGKRRQ